MQLNPHETVLLVVDFQPYYLRRQQVASYFNTVSFAKAAPEALTQIWVAQDIKDKTHSDPLPLAEQEQQSLFGKAVPVPHALTMVKGYYSAFTGTGLLEYLDRNCVRNVLIGGLYGEACVGMTAADSHSYDFNTILLSDMVQMLDGGDVSTICPYGVKLLPSSEIRFT